LNLKIFISSLPAYWLFFEGLKLALLKSKNPIWIGLYSTPKALALIGLFFLSWISFRFLAPRVRGWIDYIPTQVNFDTIAPIKIFIIVSILSRLFLISSPCQIGEDVVPQVLSAMQWMDGKSVFPNSLNSPEPTDLSINRSSWNIRPPGASWILVPGLFLGLSVGNSILIALYALGLVSGIGWLKLAQGFSLPKSIQQFLAVFIALFITLKSTHFYSATVLTAATFPWLLIWSLFISQKWSELRYKDKVCFSSLLFFLVLGGHAFFKLSCLVTVSAIAALPFIFHILKNRRINSILLFRGITGIILFLAPYFILSKINQIQTGIGSNELYAQQNYNLQHELWGKNFTESTHGPMLATSLFSAVGYASPVQGLIHNFRDFLLNFKNYTELLDHYDINSRILGCCIASIPLSIVIFSALRKLRKYLEYENLILYFSLFTIPFLGFGIISYLHGFNYLIYSGYTSEYSLIFILFALSFSVISKKSKTSPKLCKTLVALFIALPFTQQINLFTKDFIRSLNPQDPSPYEEKQNLGESNLSQSFKLITKDSKSPKDICFFLCTGNHDDNILRVPMPSLSIHYVKNNLEKHFPKLSSKIALSVYCIMDTSLMVDPNFMKSLKSKFSKSATYTKIDNFTLKVELPAQST
jgi:hypothetical protein